jgi:hypothetical protein
LVIRALLAIIIVAFCQPVEAAIESELVRAAMAAYDSLDHAKAIELCGKALEETLTKEERIATYKTLAFAHVALGQLEAARADFVNLLRVDPSFTLDRSISPMARAELENAKSQVATTSGGQDARTLPAVTPVVRPPKPKEGQQLTVQVSYPGGVAEKMRLFYRVRGQAAYSRVQVLGQDGSFVATVPGLDVRGPGLEFHLVLLDEWSGAVAGGGSLAKPLTIDVQGRPKPIYKRPVFWGVLGGAAVVGAVVVGAVLGTRSTIGADTPGRITLAPR